MGQEESTPSPSGNFVDGEGNLSETMPERKTICDTCDLQATYRCKMRVKDLSKVRDYPYLMDYWVPQTRTIGGKYIVAYVGCDKCMSDTVKDIFTHKPEGWSESICMEDDYEEAHL